jgi:hypothetical protein
MAKFERKGNYNTFSPANFEIIFPIDYNELNSLYISAYLPEYTFGTTHVFPMNNSRIPFPGNETLSSDITVTFMIDEDLRIIDLLHQWINEFKKITDPAFDQLKGLRDINFLLYDSTRTKTIAKWTYGHCFPTNVPGIPLTLSDDNTAAITGSVSFKCFYTQFDYILAESPTFYTGTP